MPPKRQKTDDESDYAETIGAAKSKAKRPKVDSCSSGPKLAKNGKDGFSKQGTPSSGVTPKKCTRKDGFSKQGTPSSGVTPKKCTRKVDPNSKTQLRKKRTEANKRAKEAEARSTQTARELEVMNQKVRTLQELNLQGGQQGKDFVQDDRTIRANVDLLFDMIADWAGEWAKRGHIMKHFDNDQAAVLMSWLRAPSEDLEGQLLRAGAEDKFFWGPAGCRIAVESIVCTTITEEILTRPLHFLLHQENDDSTPSEHAFTLIRRIMKENLAETKVWYSHTLRSMYASYQYEGPISETVAEDYFCQHRKQSYKFFIDRLLVSKESAVLDLLRCIDSTEAEERRADLTKIFSAAGKLSLQLWAQDSKVESFYPDNLWRDILVSVRKGKYNMHSLMKLDLDDESLENLVADFWVRPEIVLRRYEANDMHGTPMIASRASFTTIFGDKWKESKEKSIQAEALADKSMVTSKPTHVSAAGGEKGCKVKKGTSSREGQPEAASTNQLRTDTTSRGASTGGASKGKKQIEHQGPGIDDSLSETDPKPVYHEASPATSPRSGSCHPTKRVDTPKYPEDSAAAELRVTPRSGAKPTFKHTDKADYPIQVDSDSEIDDFDLLETINNNKKKQKQQQQQQQQQQE